jgi:hypothetical protein
MIKKVLSGTFESGKKEFIITNKEINLIKRLKKLIRKKKTKMRE